MLQKSILLYIGIAALTVVGYQAIAYNDTHQGSLYGFIYGLLTYHPALRILTFVAGSFCAVWFLKNTDTLKRLRPFSPYIMVFSVVAIFTFLAVLPMKENSMLNYGLLTPLYFLFVISICNMSGRLNKILSHQWCIFLGDISYGMYILQVPVQMFFINYIMDTKTPLGFTIYLAILLVVSAVSYFHLEKILRDSWNKKLLSKISAKTDLVQQH